MMRRSIVAMLAPIALILAIGASAQVQVPMLAGVAELKDASGKTVGRATFSSSLPEGGVLIRVDIEGLTAGTYSLHIHTIGVCTPPGFQSAGDHFNPDNRRHGFMNPEGPHAGDLPNMIVAASGRARYETANYRITLGPGANSVFDADGSALVIHATIDDYVTDPAGNAGARQVCGIVVRRDGPVTQIEPRNRP